jgi:glutamate/tyrosine decarboxylase-like PLP-dependent enzyme
MFIFALGFQKNMNDSFQSLVDYVISKVYERLQPVSEQNIQLRKALPPKELRSKLDLQIEQKAISPDQLLAIVQEVVAYSVNTNHPYFMNQMFGKMQPISLLADVLISVLNTSMYTYEVAPALTLIEKETIGFLASKVWGEGIGDGVFTSGGSMSNMKALFLARQSKLPHIKNKGFFGEKPVAIFISEQAHYSFTKGVNFMGFGDEALIKIKSKSDARIDIDDLNEKLKKSIADGKIPLMLVAIAGTTISATYDPIDEMASIAKKHNMWFHVDAAFGGALLFSDAGKHKLKGIEYADSVGWNFHKAMGMPLTTSSFLTKEKGELNEAFHVSADYLFHNVDDDYDQGQKSLQGGRRPDVLKLWMSLKYQGESGFKQRIEALRNRAVTFATMIENTPYLELFQQPDSLIVCFRYNPQNVSIEEANQINIKIRESIFNEGNIIFNYAPLHDKIYLRCVILDPDYTDILLKGIITTVLKKAHL